MSEHRSGFVALVGAPNAGKSTLLNQVLGTKVSITSSKPQTTRNRVIGIYTGTGLQAVLVDTPGIHRASTRLNKAMVEAARGALVEVDAVCWVFDAAKASRRLDRGKPLMTHTLELIESMLAELPQARVCLALNKIDVVEKPKLLPLLAGLGERFPAAELVPVSALKGSGVKILIEAWRRQLPEGPPHFPADQLMDASERFVVAELVREKIFHLTRQEVPYSTAVEIEKFEELDREGPDPRVRIYALILVETDSQKGILIGKGGSMLKRVGTLARKDIQALLGARVHLELHVSVRKAWTTDGRALRELGYES